MRKSPEMPSSPAELAQETAIDGLKRPRRRGWLGRGSAAVIAALLVSAAGLLAVVGTAAAATMQPGTAGSTCTAASSGPASDPTRPKPLRGICRFLESRRGVVQVALFDKKTGRSYSLATGEDKQFTASIVKVDILAGWLHDYQQQGAEIPDDIPYSIKYLMANMIEHSDNSAATALFHFGGGCEALTSFNSLIPLKETRVACESATYYGWGNTTTTARDQVKLMKIYAYGKRSDVLGRDARSYGLQLMQSVEPDQRFGVSCGPWGTSCDPPNYAQSDPDVTVALKNGWKTLPTCTRPIEQCPWQVNSTGWIRGKGRNYALTVLTTRDPVGTGGNFGFNYGIDTIQGVSKRIWDNLD